MVPDGWKAVSFGDLAQVQGGFAFKSSTFVDCNEDSVPVVRMSNLKAGRLDTIEAKRVPRALVEKLGQFALNDGDFLLGMSGSLGNYAWVTAEDLPCYLNQRVGRLAGCNGHSRFAAYLYLSPVIQRQIETQAAGAAQLNISPKQIAAMPVMLPPLPEQRKIAAILSSVDDAIEKTQAVIAQVQVVKKGLMQELLTRGLPGRHKRFKQTEIGEVPEEWEVVTIGAVLESCTYGVNCRCGADASLVPVLRMGNIQEDRLDIADLKYADLTGMDPQKVFLRRNDVLFNRTNSYDLVGKVALVDTEQQLSYASYLLRLRADSRQCTPAWLHARMAAPDFQTTLRNIATKGVSQSNINPSKMRALKIALPSLAEQTSIASFARSFDQRIAAERAKLSAVLTLKSALMSVLLTGEVRVQFDGSTNGA